MHNEWQLLHQERANKVFKSAVAEIIGSVNPCNQTAGLHSLSQCPDNKTSLHQVPLCKEVTVHPCIRCPYAKKLLCIFERRHFM